MKSSSLIKSLLSSNIFILSLFFDSGVIPASPLGSGLGGGGIPPISPNPPPLSGGGGGVEPAAAVVPLC